MPAGHTIAVELVDREGQAYPAVHSPAQFAVVVLVALPNLPAGQSLQTSEPSRLYFPTGHTRGVAVFGPQTNPAGHGKQLAVVLPVEPALYFPEAHII